MMELWGSDTCATCRIARELLGQTPLEWKYVDVAQTGYEGLIPLLITDDGRRIESLGPIKNHVMRKLREMGIPINKL